jgi:PmbA protein
MTHDLLSITSDVVAMALKAGATSADALAISSHAKGVSLRHGVIEELEQSESQDVGLRVFVGQSAALIGGSVLTREGLQRLVDRAIAMAKLAPPDPYAGIAAPEQLVRDVKDLDLVSQVERDMEQLKALALRAEDAALAVKGVTRSNGASSSASRRQVAMAASNGFARSWERTSFSTGASVVAGEGTAMERDYDGHGATHFEDLDQPEKIGTTAGERAVARLNPRKIASQTCPVIYDRRVASSLFGHLLGGISGAAIARGTSFLKEDMGKAIFAPHVTLVEDPHRLRGPGSRPFDGEGLPTHQRNIIDKGVLTTWIMDLRAARQLGLPPTGHGSRGLTSPPGASPSNLHVEAGARSPEDMMRDMGSGLLVTEFIGSTINMVTGDYSRGASGFWIEGGEIAYPVSGITVAGNLRDMFANLEPASDLIFRGSMNVPSCYLGNMTIAGT